MYSYIEKKQKTSFFNVLVRGYNKWILLLLMIGCYQFGSGIYIFAKAQMAQLLIGHSWQQHLTSQSPEKPWSWADTWPIAKLSFAGENIFVLEGASLRVLAFGPGHMQQTPLPGNPGNSVIVGHRDTHFAALEGLAIGDVVEVETQKGTFAYAVTDLRVAHKEQISIIDPTTIKTLTLVTCYPFNEVQANTPYRYVVKAEII